MSAPRTIVAAAALMLTFGCGASQQVAKPSSPLAAAKKARDDGQLQDAERHARAAAKSGDQEATMLLAEVLVLRGQHREAAALLAPLFLKHRENAKAALLLARAHDGAGNGDKAIAAYARRLRLVPTDKPAALRLAELLLARGDHLHASRVAKAMRKQSPNDPVVLTLLSRSELARGMLAAALKSATIATENGQRLSAPWLQLARVHVAMGEHRLAIEAYRRCLGNDAQHSDALLGLGGLLVEQREYQQAATVLSRAVKVRPDDVRGWNALAAVHNRLGQHDQAVAAMRKAHELRPRHPLVLRNLVEVLLDAGQPNEAVALAEQLAEIMRADGVSETARAGLRRSLVRSIVVAAVAQQLCRGANSADDVARQAIDQLRSHGLTATRPQVTRFAADAVPQAKAALRNCKSARNQGATP